MGTIDLTRNLVDLSADDLIDLSAEPPARPPARPLHDDLARYIVNRVPVMNQLALQTTAWRRGIRIPEIVRAARILHQAMLIPHWWTANIYVRHPDGTVYSRFLVEHENAGFDVYVTWGPHGMRHLYHVLSLRDVVDILRMHRVDLWFMTVHEFVGGAGYVTRVDLRDGTLVPRRRVMPS